MSNFNKNSVEQTIKIIERHNGIIRTKDALKAGIQPRTLYFLRDEGLIEVLAKGLFKLSSHNSISELDIVTIALKYPNAVICLISALSFYGITTQIPHMVYIALKKGSETPRIEYPPISVHRLSGENYSIGIQEKNIDGINAKIYSIEKTLVDCFKFRNKIGLDTAIEALKLYKANYKPDVNKILKYAKVCRVYNVIKPYMEAII